MNIIVCIKQVPDTADVKIDFEKGTLIREGVKSIMNPFDAYAVEEALRVRERLGDGSKVIALSMGPPQAEDVIKEAIAMGADDGILLSDRAFAGADTLATSYSLAMAIKKIGDFGLIFAGRQAIDGDTGQTGPELATWLGIPQVTYVSKIEEITPEKAIVHRMMVYGFDRLEVKLPAVFTVVKDINQPRLPSFRGVMKAKRFKVKVWTAEDVNADRQFIGLDGSPTRVRKMFAPPQKHKNGVKWEGEPSELAERLAKELHKLGLIR